MICKLCQKKAVFSKPNYCKNHFIDYFENKVFETIKKYKLLNKKDSVVVACSGGKDSTTILYLLSKIHKNVTALAIDEGIVGYRNKTLEDLNNFCNTHKIKLKIYYFKKEIGKTLDVMLEKKNHPCSICGTYRRYLLNKYGQEYDKLATGHNMDDESQAVLMNILKGNTSLVWNSTPITPKVKGFVQKIKPLYFCSEKEVAAYTILKGFNVGFTECPYVNVSYRNKVRELLNEYDLNHEGTKRNILKKHLSQLKKITYKKVGFQYCSECGEPSQDYLCKACKLTKSFK